MAGRPRRYARLLVTSYRLAVLTHDRMSTLDESLASFTANVTPQPEETFVYADGVWESLRREWAVRHRGRYLFRAGAVQRGFCAATAALWEWATEPGADYVFWLEHDFVFTRPVDLEPLASLLNIDRRLAQVSLCRGPANAIESAAGGLVESRPGEFEPRDTADRLRWLQHRSYFTTNPSLMRRDFMVENPFVDDREPNCEGRYGVDLVSRGFSFGLWGAGEPWCDHIGIRNGLGY